MLLAGPSEAQQTTPVSFGKSLLKNASSVNPTSLQFGPDGRLYVAQQDGNIKAYTIQRDGANAYSVTNTETIGLIKAMPNRNDDGSLNPSVTGRQVTGILVAGTQAQPEIYVGSSDPRIGAGGSGTDLNLDTNSGIISRLSWDGSKWVKTDLVRGLPRSEENHSVNGMQLSADGQTLFVAAGGNTNQGGASNNFALLPEYALSAAILEIDLAAIGNTTYDLPTLDDEDRPGNPDANDPFGGNDGKNQAKIVPGGPVQVYAPGFRNSYDLVIANSGKMYTIDNGGNSGWGDIPVGEGPGGTCTNQQSEPGNTNQDNFHHISGQGYYGGHPNPTRGNQANKFNTSNPQSPVAQANPVECDYDKPETGTLTTFPATTNGLDEYTASNFGGTMQGNLLAAGGQGDNRIYRIQLDASGNMTKKEALFSAVGSGGFPLDVTAQGDNEQFPGTIWVADVYGNDIVAFEPAAATSCDASDPNGDSDGDGFTNSDEQASGTDPCSAADVPPDWDKDKISDKTDPDDDNDGQPDTSDPFALDPDNGTTTGLPLRYDFTSTDQEGGLLNLGFSGLMTNGTTDYQNLYDPNNLTAGGAAGVLTVDQVSEGDAYAGSNNQENAYQSGFQTGVDVSTGSGVFTARTRVAAPFAGITPQDYQSMGLFLGTGDQDNYVKLVTSSNGGQGGIEFAKEVGGQFTHYPQPTVPMPGPDWVDLYLTVDAVAKTVQPSYVVSTGGNPGALNKLGDPVPIPDGWVDSSKAMAAGLTSTSFGGAPPFTATWDFIEVQRGAPDTTPGAPAVASTEPQDGATGVAIAANVDATYSEAMDASTMKGSTFTLAKAGSTSPVAATVTYDGASKKATLDPSANLEANTTYTATLKGGASGVKDLAGNHLASDKTWSFTTAGPASETSAASVTIDAGGTMEDSSTYNSGSFKIKNTSPSGQKIQKLRIDLSSSVLPDMLFDPKGTAGDTTAKCFQPDSGTTAAGLVAPNDPCASPFSSPRDGGYEVIELEFNNFDANEEFTFSVDVDPTSTKGLVGSGGAASVSGLELSGALATAVFDDGSSQAAQTSRIPQSVTGSQNTLKAGLPAQPTIEVLGVSAPAKVQQAQQTVRVTGLPNSSVSLMVLEGGMFTPPPGGFYDPDPYEANSIVKVAEQNATIGPGGTVDIPVTLTRSADTAGLNHIVAVTKDANGNSSPNSNVLILEYASTTVNGGLKGEYYDNQDLTNLKVTRTDPKVDFSWGSGSPDPSIAPNTFSVRWSGQIKVDYAETYTFYTSANDGARLWVNGQQIINRWSDGAQTNTGTISLQAGQWYPITMEYYEGINTASAKLEYSSPSTPRQVVPSDHLSPEAPPDTTAPTVSNVAPQGGATGVAVGTNVEATFSEAMDASTAIGSNFTLTKQGTATPVNATVSYDATAKKALLNPSADLEAGATYTATIKGGTGGVKDLAGNPLANDKTWSFTTATAASNNLTAPSNLSATRSGNAKAQRIDLSWSDNSTSETKFVIERSTTSAFTTNLVTYEAGANAVSYRDTAVNQKTTYYYRVIAVNAAGTRSASSNVASATTK
jgi:hypothetical protein